MLKNEHKCLNININAQNLALITKNEHLCPFLYIFSIRDVRTEYDVCNIFQILPKLTNA